MSNSLRPSTAEREAFRDVLAQGYAEGRLNDEEFASRQDLVDQALTIGELLSLVEGLLTKGLVLPDAPLARVEQAPRRTAWGRRTVLGFGAVAVGFVAAGGIGKIAGRIDFDPAEIELPGSSIDAFAPGGLDKPIQWLVDHGYESFTELSMHDDMFFATAIAPGRQDVLDDISMTGHQPASAEPAGELDEEAMVFELADVDLSLIPEYVRVAPGLIGGKVVTHIIVDAWEGEVAVRPYVEGNEYGQGGGYLVWSADGQRLIRIAR